VRREKVVVHRGNEAAVGRNDPSAGRLMNELQQQQPANQYCRGNPKMNVSEHARGARLNRLVCRVIWHGPPPQSPTSGNYSGLFLSSITASIVHVTCSRAQKRGTLDKFLGPVTRRRRSRGRSGVMSWGLLWEDKKKP